MCQDMATLSAWPDCQHGQMSVSAMAEGHPVPYNTVYHLGLEAILKPCPMKGTTGYMVYMPGIPHPVHHVRTPCTDTATTHRDAPVPTMRTVARVP